MELQEKDAIRVLLVDDHRMVRSGIRVVIESQPSMTVVAEASSRSEALDAATSTQPHVILLDLDLGDENGIDFLPDLLDATTGSRVLLLTGQRDPEVHRQAVRLGAMGVVQKEQPVETIVKAIKKVHSGEVWLERSMVANVLNDFVQQRATGDNNADTLKVAALTVRERELIGLIGEGVKNQQIAERLSVSEATVRNHVTSIFSKLGVNDRVELVVYAYRHGLAALPHE